VAVSFIRHISYHPQPLQTGGQIMIQNCYWRWNLEGPHCDTSP